MHVYMYVDTHTHKNTRTHSVCILYVCVCMEMDYQVTCKYVKFQKRLIFTDILKLSPKNTFCAFFTKLTLQLKKENIIPMQIILKNLIL